MPPRQTIDIAHLSKGVNYRGFVGSVTMQEGEAQDSLDMLPREDGSFYKTFGWKRINDSALTGRPIAARGFSYRGKNADTGGGDTARPGNFGLADDGADFTRRTDEFSTFLLLTDSTGYFWNPATQTFDTISLPGGVSVDPDPKPTIQVFKENAYIVGWATVNLRYDPTDRAFYAWGWEAAPVVPVIAADAGGTLTAGAVYKYGYTYFDLYTGEETTLSPVAEITPSGVALTVDLSVTSYAGSRHFNDLAVATDSDVGIAIYRTNEDDDAYYLLTTLPPGTTLFSDTGLAVDTSLSPFRGTMQDEPRFSALQEFKSRFYALSRKSNSNRLYFSDFTHAPFVERWSVLGYRDLYVYEGDTLTAIGKTDVTLLAYTRKGCFRTSVIEGTGTPQIIPNRLPWDVGCVGPRARMTVRGWDYFMSDRGPYRWREGLSEPQWIGENISPLFIDPVSGLCKLNEVAREQTEVGLEWISNTVRFVFAIGDSTIPNMQLAYWIEAERVNGSPLLGWWPQSLKVQTMDLSSSIAQLDNTGRPVSGADRQERLVVGDEDGYMYEYDLAHKRGGLKEGALARGFVNAGSTVSSLAVGGGLFTTGDGLTGMRVEVLSSADGTTQERKIASNTDSAIVPTVDFDTAPALDDIWFVGGIPSYWRSWVDHFGDPHMHKSLVNLYVGFMQTGSDDTSSQSLNEWILDVNVGAGDFPTSFDRTRTAKLSKYRAKLLMSLTGRFFVYEFSNSRPDEPVAITNMQRDVIAILAKRFA
jgi:hypothetical protein